MIRNIISLITINYIKNRNYFIIFKFKNKVFCFLETISLSSILIQIIFFCDLGDCLYSSNLN